MTAMGWGNGFVPRYNPAGDWHRTPWWAFWRPAWRRGRAIYLLGTAWRRGRWATEWEYAKPADFLLMR